MICHACPKILRAESAEYLLLAKLISQIWAFWLANIKKNLAITQSKGLDLGNYFFLQNQFTDDSALKQAYYYQALTLFRTTSPNFSDTDSNKKKQKQIQI